MGSLKNGPFSGFTGRVGSLVGYRRARKWILAAVRATEPGPPTESQLGQQMKFGMFTSWLANVGLLIDIGFIDREDGQSEMNAAVKYNMKHAVTGTSPVFTIDYPKVLFTQGRLAGPNGMAFELSTDAQIDFSWKPNLGLFRGDTSDLASFVVYNPVKENFVYLIGPATRDTLAFEMEVPINYSGDEVHVWMAFVGLDKKSSSTSLYVGAMTIL